ncbi:FAD-dependent oxidoreductase, partial [Patescibacteria group bacterium]|nr:FAD-dependent oxidoreductase [Patescibacteria group bacterium]
GVEVESIKKAGQNFLIKTKEGESFETKTIIIATGKILRQLNVPGEKEFKNKGITYCSICDAPLFSGKDVAVVGGGNSGMESAMDLIKYANKVYLMSRGEKIKGDEFLQDKLKKTGKVEFITNVEIKEIKGNKFVEKIIYKDKKSGEEKELPVGGIFVNIGWVPATNFLEELIETNNHGEIITDSKTQQTSLAGIFAAGDVTDSLYKQIVIAVGDGAKATLSAYNYLIKEK